MFLWALESRRLFPVELPIELMTDDSTVKSYGQKVEGSGRMHDPTNPPCRNGTCRGRSLVMAGMIATRPLFGRICLPIGRNFVSTRTKVGTIDEKIRPQFKTKPKIAAERFNGAIPAIDEIMRRIGVHNVA